MNESRSRSPCSSRPVMEIPARQIGIDENGLGPRLGPMVVTAVAIEVNPRSIPHHQALHRTATRAGIGDSKTECAHGAMSTVESKVLALLECHLGITPGSLQELWHALGHEDERSLRADCPPGEAPEVCFGDPVSLPAFGPGPRDEDRHAAERLARDGIKLRAVRTAMICAKRLNRARQQGRSRFDLDLSTMVQLASALRACFDTGDVTALCGKVGARKHYAPALTALAPLVTVIEETPARSRYYLPGFGEMHFILDGDASEPAIGLASMVGKYIRELWMHRHNRYWNTAVPGSRPVSGYHDPATARLIAATALVRRQRAIPDECFER